MEEPQPPSVPPSNPLPQPPSQPSAGLDPKQWAVITHVSGLAGVVIPFGNIIAPLVLWLIKKSEIPSLDQVGRDVLNFQISYTIYGVAAAIIGVIGSCLIVPIFLPIAVLIAWLVFLILGAVKASNGERYVFPLAIKML
jgi:hypothetical protein